MANAMFVNEGRCLIAACKSPTYTQQLYRCGSTILYTTQEMSCIETYIKGFDGFSLESIMDEISEKDVHCSHTTDSLIIGGRNPDLLTFYAYSFRRHVSQMPAVGDEFSNSVNGPGHTALARFTLDNPEQLEFCFANERGARVLYSPHIRLHILPDEYGRTKLESSKEREQARTFNSLSTLLKTHPDQVYAFADEIIRWRC